MENRGHCRPMVSIEEAASAASSCFLSDFRHYGLLSPVIEKLWRKDANFANEIASCCICLLCLI